MIQSIYTSVSNAGIKPCKKGLVYRSEPIPLLRDNFLNEYRTELEKAKVRKNLGIKDSETLEWKDMGGNVEDSASLSYYIRKVWEYKSDLNESIVDVKSALDYLVGWVQTFTGDHDTILSIEDSVKELESLLDALNSADRLYTLETSVREINTKIEEINKLIESVNDSIKLSEEAENAIVAKDDGLYVKDFSLAIKALLETPDTYETKMEEIAKVPTKVGGIEAGTTAELLKGKSFIELFDAILFPTYVRPLVQPYCYFSGISSDLLVEVGSQTIKPTLVYVKGDAPDTYKSEITLNGGSAPVSYATKGDYTYKGTVTFEDGEKLVNNKGEVTDSYIKAGSVSTETTIHAVYPWYAGTEGNLNKQPLAMGLVTVTVNLGGKAQLKFPKGTKITSFLVDIGAGFTDVNMFGWTVVDDVDLIYTKDEAYTSTVPHKIVMTI